MEIRKAFRNGVFLVVGLLLIIASDLNATHLRAGEITVERISCQGLTFRITITIFTDIGPGITAKFGDGFLKFGDGTPDELVPLIDNPINLGNDIGFNQYVTTHTYTSNGTYTISYTEPNRNEGVLNMANSINTPFHLETQIVIDPFLGCNNTPVLLVPPIDRACVGSAFFHNPGAFDFEGDSISYEIVNPKQNVGQPVSNYELPNSSTFGGSSESGGPPIFNLDPASGNIVWDAPGKAGEYNIAFIVVEWRVINGVAFRLGHVTRDMQIIVEECDNERPELRAPEDICVVAGTTIEEVIIGFDQDGDNIMLEAFGGPFELNPSATITPDPPIFQTTPGALEFQWRTTCDHVREQPYQVEFKVTDDPPDGPKLVSFATWNITVIAPPPNLLSADLDLATGRQIKLKWDPYECNNVASIPLMEVWRRVDGFDIVPEECETGMPQNAGYSLIATVPIIQTDFIDNNNGKGLDVGAVYCYRLVATFAPPLGGQSIVSNEICADPIEADAPVITHVTVDKTDRTDGRITVSWRSPFEINQTQFTPPYRYEVVRAIGLSGSQSLEVVTSTSDTTITDSGLNTLDNAYNYRIRLFDSNNFPVDTSAIASSVHMEPNSLFKKIELNWSAEVPWSNVVQDFPLHEIYRDHVGADPNQFQLIASVDVTENGFLYLDSGQFNGVPLQETTEYCYYVTTAGTYGNALIDIPQLNNSQIACAQPSDTIPPCAPVLTLDVTSCEEFIADKPCEFIDFSNTLNWARKEDDECLGDIKSYNIYFSRSGEEGTFEIISNVPSTSYVHDGLTSFIGCYMITALDRSGNESDSSEMVCSDNCPNFQLPNVFTPNNDAYNNLFTVFNSPSEFDAVGEIIEDRCPRFVEFVNFKVFNRWGNEVYAFNSAGENSIFINWDGRSSDGKALPAGVYYYVAEVTFDVLDKANAIQEFKGWVQIIR